MSARNLIPLLHNDGDKPAPVLTKQHTLGRLTFITNLHNSIMPEPNDELIKYRWVARHLCWRGEL
jgi:hypothetical protein